MYTQPHKRYLIFPNKKKVIENSASESIQAISLSMTAGWIREKLSVAFYNFRCVVIELNINFLVKRFTPENDKKKKHMKRIQYIVKWKKITAVSYLRSFFKRIHPSPLNGIIVHLCVGWTLALPLRVSWLYNGFYPFFFFFSFYYVLK